MKTPILLLLAPAALLAVQGCEKNAPPPDFRMDVVNFLVSQAQIAPVTSGRKVPVALSGITALATTGGVSDVVVDLVYDGGDPGLKAHCRYVLTGKWNADKRVLAAAVFREVCDAKSTVLAGAQVIWRGRQTPSAECVEARRRGDASADFICKADDCRRKNELTLLVPDRRPNG
jgi:hypothetical protein